MAAKRVRVSTPTTDDRIRFNWGYHDAAQDFREGWGDRRTPEGAAHMRPLPTWDAAYCAGYARGYDDAAAKKPTTTSGPAWAAETAARGLPDDARSLGAD